MSKDNRTQVSSFYLQATSSYPNGAPQRENYLDEAAFYSNCYRYANEWREKYFHSGRCQNHDCPQCFQCDHFIEGWPNNTLKTK